MNDRRIIHETALDGLEAVEDGDLGAALEAYKEIARHTEASEGEDEPEPTQPSPRMYQIEYSTTPDTGTHYSHGRATTMLEAINNLLWDYRTADDAVRLIQSFEWASTGSDAEAGDE